jgi:hypothetical protein
MTPSKNANAEERKKTIAIAVFAMIALGLLYYELGDYFFPSKPTTVSAPVADNPASESTPASKPTGTAAKSLGSTSAALDPTLHMEAMLVTESVEYSGSGRNIFSPNSAPPPVSIKPIAPARPTVTQPVVPMPVQTPTVVPPPVIDLKFFGVAERGGTRQALLLHDDNIFLASTGEIVLRRYRIVSIAAKSIQVEDMQYKNTQTLPLLTN